MQNLLLTSLLTCVLVLSRATALAQVSQPDVTRWLTTQPRMLFTLKTTTTSRLEPTASDLTKAWVSLEKVRAEIPTPRIVGAPFVPAPDGSSFYRRWNDFIQQFDRSGRLIRAVRVRKSEDRHKIALQTETLYVDYRGRIFLMANTPDGDRILVFAPDGQQLKDVEQRIQRAREQVRLNDDLSAQWHAMYRLYVDRNDRLHLVGNHRHVRIDLKTGQWCFFRHGGCFPRRDGTCIRPASLVWEGKVTVRHYSYDASGNVSFSTYDEDKCVGDTIQVFEANGLLVRQYRVPAGDVGEVEKLLPVYRHLLGFDVRGHYYARRCPDTLVEVSLGSDRLVKARRYQAVCEYDSNGKFVGIRAVVTLPEGDDVFLDEEGNLYWAEYEIRGDEAEQQLMRLMVAPAQPDNR